MQDNTTPYTYLIGWSSHNKWYYGRRTRKGCHPEELWVKYFTSSKHVKSFAKQHGKPDIIQIRRVFDNSKKCADWETKVLRRVPVDKVQEFLALGWEISFPREKP